MAATNREVILQEILSTDNISNYMAFAYNLGGQVSSADPSWVWEQLRFNPWLAMQVYDDMEEKDGMLSTVLETRKEGVLAKERRVIPASQKRQDINLASFIEETVEGYFDVTDGVRTGLDSTLFEALDAVGRGVSIGEIIYANAPDRVYIKSIKFKPQQLFAFGEGAMAAYSSGTFMYPQTGPLRLRPGIILDNWSGETPLPENKFFVHSFRPRYGNRWGSPLDRKAYWASWFKRAGVKQWLRYAEKGSGSVIARYNDGAAADEQNKALQAAQAVNEESAVALPAKFALEVLQHVRQSMGSTYSDLIDGFCNSEIARIYLGQTLTSRGSDGGGSRALGEVHERVSEKKVSVDAKSLIVAFNTQIIWPLVIFNAGPVARPPIWWINHLPERDHSAISTWLARLWEMRVPISKSFVYNNFQGLEPQGEEDVLPLPVDDKAPSIPAGGVDPTAFSEGKGPRPDRRLPVGSSGTSKPPQSLSRERFKRLRPSMMERSAK